MKIGIIGVGYVGLVTGACLAETGLNVFCIDIDANKISKLQEGIIPIYEPGLDKIVKDNIIRNRLHFATSIKEIINECEAIFIAVGTPPGEDGSADLQYVLSVAKEIGQYIEKYIVVVTKSTVPVGTSYKVKKVIEKELAIRNKNIEFDVASNPEFLKEGNAIDDFLKPDRIVIGVESVKAEKILNRVYNYFYANNYQIFYMDILSSELTKYIANCMLATKISFMNDIANLCELLGADVKMIKKGVGSDSRIGDKFLNAGLGYGGSCFPKDVKALLKTAKDNNYDLQIINSAEKINKQQPQILVNKIINHFNNDIKGKTFAIWGLAFKPNTDDMREAPSVKIITSLLDVGAKIKAYDPVAMEEAKKIFGNKIDYFDNKERVLENADALIIVTEWAEFYNFDIENASKLLKNKVIFDGRNILEWNKLKEYNFTYYCVGKK